MLKFQKLRLQGFKSFVDSSELFITDGLTGIVGPNGCGKSNLVEALKWTMGETSAKQMRGKDMEDVIFAGSSDRPGRNIAEVVLTLDNKERTAPPQFNDADELEISRKIERDKGSTYRVNGKEVRARDVQLLFADQSTGARSTAMVSQGRVGAVINAKPAQRRLLLEEAAGITGLHSRRHEAELRLRAAETNLERLDDILGTLDTQMNSLKKQARQATRYRNLSDHIKKAEAALFFVRWQHAQQKQTEAAKAFKLANEEVQRLTLVTSEASRAQEAASQGLPELRQAETEAAAELQRLTLARQSLDQEEARIEDAKRDRTARIEQAVRDKDRENALVSDAADALDRLESEQTTLIEAQAAEQEALAAAETALRDATDLVNDLDRDVSRLTEDVATGTARRSALERRLGELEAQVQRLTLRREETQAEQEKLESQSADLVELADAETAVEVARVALETARTERAAAEPPRKETQDREETSKRAEREAYTELRSLETETRTLRNLIASDGEGDWEPILEQITVEPGFEGALGAALGDDLGAPADGMAPIHWRDLPPLAHTTALPTGTRSLADVVKAPPALARRLAQVGVLESDAEAERLQGTLGPGQRLVSRAGGLWRWDGFTVREGAETAAAKRLAQKNRLADLETELDEKTRAHAALKEAASAAQYEAREARTHEEHCRTALRDADQAFNRARDHLERIKERAQSVRARIATLSEQMAQLAGEIEEAETLRAEGRDELASLPEMAQQRETLAERRALLGEKRAAEAACRSRFTELDRDARARKQRLDAITAERATWHTRKQASADQLTTLDQRQADLAEDLASLESKPAEIAAKRDELLSAIEGSEAKRKALADKLSEAEGGLQTAARMLRDAETALAEARETRVRTEGGAAQADQAIAALIERIQERLQLRPEGLAHTAEIDPEGPLPDLETTERKAERLNRERDTMGPVNLRADEEMRELNEQLDTLGTEKEDLIKAIARLRQGISEINKEGRARLLASFKEVDAHFKELFVKLFGGGEAHLELIESDDPLEAGLEIFASPPGKKLQALSLLSGGEQALTAIALLFAVFQTNPAPICVLDEVDAPLDDANVDRFCAMLEDMVRMGTTRFLIITHHRMTMARMQRLFGVTMQERGVSQLVSVDLERAEELRATG